MYLKLAKLMMQRGFIAEAKQNLLEYAERMQKDGQVEEAFRALKEFADLSPASEEIRLMLAEQLKNAARTDEAREQLAKLYHEIESSKDSPRKRSTVERMRAIDPEYDLDSAPAPKRKGKKQEKTSDIVFLDLNEEASVVSGEVSEPVDVEPEPLDIERTALDEGDEVLEVADPPTDLHVERASVEITASDINAAMTDAEDVDGLEMEEPFEAPDMSTGSGLEVESTALVDSIETPEVEALETEAMVAGGDEQLADDIAELPDLEGVADTEDEPPEGGDLPLLEIPESAEAPAGETIDFSEDIDLGDIDDDAGIEVPELDMDFGVADLPLLDSDEAPEVEPEPVAATDDALILADTEFGPAPETGPPDIDALESSVLDDPDAPGPHRDLAEALIELGERDRGLQELDIALAQYQESGDRASADSINEEILRLEPNSIAHHRRRVEYVVGGGDASKVISAHVELADALVRSGMLDDALKVYEAILEQDAENERAKAAIDTLKPFEEIEVPADVVSTDDRPEVAEAEVAEVEEVEEVEPAVEEPVADASGFVDLGALILEDEGVKDTRMRIDHAVSDPNEQQDFQDMLSEFKKGIDANVELDDSQAHYDLGVAFKEMGLLDEAISEFQKALRGADGRLRTSEALGMCFHEKGQFAVAVTVLRRAIEAEPGADDEKIGLLYWLARSEEEQGHAEPALSYYQRVFSIDIAFQDVNERVKALTEAGS